MYYPKGSEGRVCVLLLAINENDCLIQRRHMFGEECLSGVQNIQPWSSLSELLLVLLSFLATMRGY